MLPKSHMRFVALATLLAGGVLGSRVARADDWPTLGLDGVRTRLAAERSGAAFSDGRWTFTPPKGGERVLSSPVVAEGFAVTVDLNGNLSVLRADTGARAVWLVSQEI